MDKLSVMERLASLPEEIALVEAEMNRVKTEICERQQELGWLQITLNKKQNEFRAMQSIGRLIKHTD